MTIRSATLSDLPVLSRHDHHISPEELESLIHHSRVYVAEDNGVFIGWLRWNLFWDNTPFMNLLYLLEDFRGKGFGKAMVACW
jgi:GNAT superfamily N-acetyltransferase